MSHPRSSPQRSDQPSDRSTERTSRTGDVRTGRRLAGLLDRVRPGDVVVLAEPDLDRAAAEALVERRVAVVAWTGPALTGRWAARGPAHLLEADVLLVQQVGDEALQAVRDGDPLEVRTEGGVVRLLRPPASTGGTGTLVATGRPLTAQGVRDAMAAADAGLHRQLDALTAQTAELLRQEERLLLHGEGLPPAGTGAAGRPALVVGPAGADDLASARSWVRQHDPVLVAVGRGADVLATARLRPDVVVVAADDEVLPAAAALRRVRDVVVVAGPGQGSAAEAQAERLVRLGARPGTVRSRLTAADVALLLADAGEARVVVAAGLGGSLADLLDAHRAGLAGGHLVRLRLGPRLVDAAALPDLEHVAGRTWPLVVVLLAGLVAVAAAVATTPVGQDWARDLLDLFARLTAYARNP